MVRIQRAQARALSQVSSVPKISELSLHLEHHRFLHQVKGILEALFGTMELRLIGEERHTGNVVYVA